MNGARDAGGLWDALAAAEEGAVSALSVSLEPLEPAIRACFEAGVEVPTLPVVDQGPDRLRYAAIFLKRTLTDLRATWLLVRRGYTAAAAATAAALWENSLAAACLAHGSALVDALEASASGDLPWPPQRLAKEWAKDPRGRSRGALAPALWRLQVALQDQAPHSSVRPSRDREHVSEGRRVRSHG